MSAMFVFLIVVVVVLVDVVVKGERKKAEMKKTKKDCLIKFDSFTFKFSCFLSP